MGAMVPGISGCLTDSGPEGDFSFIHFTDVHIQPELDGYKWFLEAIKAMNEVEPKPAFAVSGGDLVMDALEASYERADSLYKIYIEAKKNFQMPVYDCIGNHECFGVYPESGVSPDHPEYGKQMFKKRLGKGRTYMSFDYRDWHFLLLDTIGLTADRKYIGEIGREQLNWIAKDLESAGTERKVVLVSHIPLVSALPDYLFEDPGDRSGWQVTDMHELAPIVEKYNLKLALSGHLHMIEEWKYKGADYYCGGAVSGHWWRGAHRGFEPGFTVVRVRGGGFDLEYKGFGFTAGTE